ncbi:MAG: cytochrome c [Magnetococcus sp. XQGC-1]
MIVRWILRSASGSKALLLGLLIGLSPVVSGQAAPLEKEQYVQSVISLLRLHANAIRQLATQEFKYSRNLARHAAALQHTFGLLGPMDWHTAEAVFLQEKKESGPVARVDLFEKMADQCQKSMKTLQQASLQHMESGGNPEPVLKALDDLQGKCNGCHDQLHGAAPDIWGKQGG